MSAEPELFWVAMRRIKMGPLQAEHWSLPVPLSMMRRATVHFGDTETWWGFNMDAAELVPNNYDVLIGYRTVEAQAAAVRIFLEAPIHVARAEFHRATRDEAVIWAAPHDHPRESANDC